MSYQSLTIIHRKSNYKGGDMGGFYDGLYNCMSVACFFYCVVDIDSLANK
jgi:hypothetical protein